MKKAALAVLVLISVFLSCKKSDSGSSGYHLTATIGGKPKNFNFTPPIATNSSPGGMATITITAILNANTGESMIISLYRASGAFTPGTYTDTTSGVDMQAVYAVSIATQFYAGTAMASQAAGTGSPVKNHLKIIISSLDAKTIKGTFSGDLFPNGDVSADPTPMVNGDFYIQIHQ